MIDTIYVGNKRYRMPEQGNAKKAEEVNGFAVFAEQYTGLISNPRMRKLAPVILAALAIATAADIMLSYMIPAIIGDVLVALVAFVATGAVHALMLGSSYDIVKLDDRKFTHIAVIGVVVLIAGFIASSYIPSAVGGSLTVFCVMSVFASWAILDTRKRQEAKTAAEAEEQQDLDSENIDDIWNEFLE